MFKALGQFSVRFRWLIVVVWLLAVPAVVLTLPSLASVSGSDNAQFLPADSPSAKAATLDVPFTGPNPAGTLVLVAVRDAGALTAADEAAIDRLERAITGVDQITSVCGREASSDGSARRTVFASTVSASGTSGEALVSEVRGILERARPSAGLSLHLTGPLAVTVDSNTSANVGGIATFSLVFIVVVLFVVFRSVLAPLLTLAPAGLVLVISEPLVAQLSKAGFSVSVVTQALLTVLVLGAGTDYGLFLVFRVREELRRGLAPREAVVAGVAKVGESITFSAMTVIGAVLSLLLASFSIYRGLGPGLGIALALLLLASLTLTPALLAIFGRAVFWPLRPHSGQQQVGFWGRVADSAISRPVAVLVAGVALFGALSLGLIGYRSVGFTNLDAPAGSGSAAGDAALAERFPGGNSNPNDLLLRFPTPVWNDPEVLRRAEQRLGAEPVFSAINGPLRATGLTPTQFTQMHTRLGTPGRPDSTPPEAKEIPPKVYRAYLGAAAFISPDGRTVRFTATLRAGAPGSQAAINAIPAARASLDAVASEIGANASGIAGPDAIAYDISTASSTSLWRVVPAVLLIIAVLLAVLLRTLIAPWYLIATVGLSYLASLGFVMIAFVHLGGSPGLNFLLPFLMFVFSMALGEDYNILLMSRVREQAQHAPDLRTALSRAVGLTGGTITSAGVILAGTFAVLGVAGAGNEQVRQIGFGIAFAVILDTFFVRTLLVPSIATLLGRWNWWPSKLSRPSTRE